MKFKQFLSKVNTIRFFIPHVIIPLPAIFKN